MHQPASPIGYGDGRLLQNMQGGAAVHLAGLPCHARANGGTDGAGIPGDSVTADRKINLREKRADRKQNPVMKDPSSSWGSSVPGPTADLLLPKIYSELRSLAAMQMRNESGYQTLQPTALVHEAWVRISSDERIDWKNNEHFIGIAAIVMRRILVERARGKATIKRKTPQPAILANREAESNEDHLIMIHECLTILEKSDPDSAKIVLLKFYGGFSNEEIARSVGWSVRTVERQWMLAKAKLYRLIRGSRGDDA